MNSKLEEKLIQYDKTTTISTSQELLDAIDFIIDNEMARPDSEIDFDLIQEAVKTAKILRNIDIEQRKKEADAIAKEIIAEVNSQVRESKQKKARVMKKKWIIPIAAILTLIIAGSIISYALGLDFLNLPNRLFRQREKKIEYYNDNNSSYVITDDAGKYKNYDEMISKENFTDLLWPADENYAEYITVKDYGEEMDISCAFNAEDGIVRYDIYTHQSFPVMDYKPTHIGNLDVYISEYDDVYQAEFSYKDNKYTVRTYSYEVLELFLKNLEEK